jgi:hypothetical protein
MNGNFNDCGENECNARRGSLTKDEELEVKSVMKSVFEKLERSLRA